MSYTNDVLNKHSFDNDASKHIKNTSNTKNGKEDNNQNLNEKLQNPSFTQM